jgi:hypothetical protein
MVRGIVKNSSGGYRLNVFYILRAAERRLHDSSLRSHDSLFMIVVHDSLHCRAAHDLALTQPLAGVRITGSLHMTIQTARKKLIKVLCSRVPMLAHVHPFHTHRSKNKSGTERLFHAKCLKS